MLPQSHAGGQGPYSRSLEQLGRSSEFKDRKNTNGNKMWQTDRMTDWLTDRRMNGQSEDDGRVARD